MLFDLRLDRSLWAIYAASFLRSLGVGLTGVILGIYLSRENFSPTFIGMVIAAGLAGAALGTILVSVRADLLGRRRTLAGLALLGALGGLGFALTTERFILLLVSFVGMMNGMGTDRGPSFALEQAIIPQLTSSERRTMVLAGHSFVLDLGHALGALAAALPLLFQHWLSVDLADSYKITFGLYGVLNLVTTPLYMLLPSNVEVAQTERRDGSEAAAVSPQTRRIVIKLAALSGIDSLGGGFMPDALIAYWFFRRFGVPETSLGVLFSVGHVLNSLSYPVAAWLSRRIGLVKTMVFTHIPSSFFIMAVPLAPSFAWAVALLLAREATVEMDVPTRQSYILGVVQPSERTFASGVSNVTRNVARAVSPSMAGYVMQHLALGMPLFLGSGLKIAYDLALYWSFRSLKPPEEDEPSVLSYPTAPKE